MIASMANYSPYVGVGVSPVKTGRHNSSISVSLRYTGIQLPEVSITIIRGLKVLFKSTTGMYSVKAGSSVTTNSILLACKGVINAKVSSTRVFLNLLATSVGYDRDLSFTGLRSIRVGTTVQAISQTFKFTGVILGEVGGIYTRVINWQYSITQQLPLAGAGVRSITIGATVKTLSLTLKYTGIMSAKLSGMNTRVNSWQTTIVSQAQNIVQTLIQFWS